MKILLRVLPFFVVFMFDSSFLNYEDQITVKENTIKDPPFLEYESEWVDSVFRTLTLDERIGQLFMVPAYSNMGDLHRKNIDELINKYHVGGLIFFQGGPGRQAILTNHFQEVSKVPLLIAGDYEWGLSMRLDSVPRFPRQMMLGAINNDMLLYEMGAEIARQCKRIGIHVNFAPVIDINNNPNNPVINSRSFGENRMNVARKGFAYMLGLQDNGVIATAKHFPGHGDTNTDSHEALPVIKHSKQRLDSIEIFPFKEMINKGLGAIMIAHLHIPSYDSSLHSASSLSKNIVNDLLIEKLKFKGLIFTDALGMQGVAKYNAPGTTELKAFIAGVDVMLMSKNIPKAIENFKNALKTGIITEEQINKRCKKILAAKKWVGLDSFEPIKIDSIYEDLNSSNADFINRKLVENSITLLKNDEKIIPFKKIDSVKIASISIGDGAITYFQKKLDLYDDVTHFVINKNSTFSQYENVRKQLEPFDYVIVGIHDTHRRLPSFGIRNASIQFIDRLSENKKVILSLFANPYSLDRFKHRDRLASIIVGFEDTEITNLMMAQLIYGGIGAKGKLPVTATKEFPSRSGIYIDTTIRFKYTVPKEFDIDEKKLKKIDSLVYDAIKERAFPGCQIFAVKNGKVFFQRSFGYHTYYKKRPVNNHDLYDLASITKIAATVPTIMRLHEQQKININQRLSIYLPELDSSNKKNLYIKDILCHQARLKPWIPIYNRTIVNTPNGQVILKPDCYKQTYDKNYHLKVAENIYASDECKKIVLNEIAESNLRRYKRYRYSDLGFYLFYFALERIINEPFDEYVNRNFYAPLGATTLSYNPLTKINKEQIVPTEEDHTYRNQLLQGYVHDQGAAMMGGVSGHAGLFANANDLAKLMQMYLQKGVYGGERYFKDETIKLFTSSPYRRSRNNRRGIGFDKPPISGGGMVFDGISDKSFGHTGFTGTIAWADPEEDIVYVFLSNRIYPDMNNRKIISMEVRQKIHKAIYDALQKG